MSEKRINLLDGLEATIKRDDAAKALEGIVILYDSQRAGVLDDETFNDKLAYPVYDGLSKKEVDTELYDLTFTQSGGTFEFNITPGGTDPYVEVWEKLRNAIVAAPEDVDDDDDDPDDEDADIDDPDDEDEDDDKSKGKKPKDNKDDESKKPKDKDDKSKSKPKPKKVGDMVYDGDRFHSDDDETEDALNEFYELYHGALS